MKRAFLEQVNGDWFDDFIFITKYQLEEQGYEIIPVDGIDVNKSFKKYTINKDTDVCIGSVELTTKFFELCQIPVPTYLGYPEELTEFLGRKIIQTTFEDLGTDYPYFVKPAEQVKLFTGDTVTKPEHLGYLKQYGNCVNDTKVYKSEVVDFVTEYRVFVSKGEIRGIKNYRGDFEKFIDIDIVHQMVNKYKTCPSAFTLDVGLTTDGRTLLIEVNDMWAIGSYGLDAKVYTLLCIRRLKEIMC